MKSTEPRRLLWPLGLLFGALALLRIKLYQWGFFHRYTPPVATLAVGNLSTGGTGKTPLVLYLAQKWGRKRSIATLSRGYGRKTKGFRWVQPADTSTLSGDEPLLLRRLLPNHVDVAVCEDRPAGIRKILQERPATNLVLLDDAYQHLALKAGFYLLTTPFSHPFYEDALLPAGNLREPIRGKKRAQAMVVTKCPPNLSHAEAAQSLERVEQLVAMIPDMEDLKASMDHNTRVSAELAIAMTRMWELEAIQTLGAGNAGVVDAATVAEERRYMDFTLPSLAP